MPKWASNAMCCEMTIPKNRHMSFFFYNLIAHVFAYVTCYRNTNGWNVQAYHLYVVCTICHMQLMCVTYFMQLEQKLVAHVIEN
jgi:hypothetical protein